MNRRHANQWALRLGAYCVPSHTTSLVYDKASKSKKRERRKAAGCVDNKKPGTNRCSKGRPGAIKGYNCDEYPFASSKAQKTANNGKENRCSRCVPSKQNSSTLRGLAVLYRPLPPSCPPARETRGRPS